MLLKCIFLISPHYPQKQRSITWKIKEGVVSLNSENVKSKLTPNLSTGPGQIQQAAHRGLPEVQHQPPDRSAP